MSRPRDSLRDAIRRIARGGRAPCRRLLELAKRRGVPPARIGRLCDEMGIRISACQLGCFR